MHINTTVTRLIKWIINPLCLIISGLYRPPLFFSEGRGGCPPANESQWVHPSPLSKFPTKPTLQMVDYRILLIENKERLNRIRYSLETAIPVDGDHVLIRGVDNSDFINHFCEYRNLEARR
jgi:hypothetical protein